MKRLAIFLSLAVAALLAASSASAEGETTPDASTATAPGPDAGPAPSSRSGASTPDAGPDGATASPATTAPTAAPPSQSAVPTPTVTATEGKPMVRARRRPKPRYGAAGCGLGSVIFGAKPGISQVTAASTNTLGMQTFGITSGTANCDSIDDHETLDAFVAMNREALAKDVARGSGETIATLTAIAGCADPQTVGQRLKLSYARIFPGPRAKPEQIARTIRTLLRADVALACENLPE